MKNIITTVSVVLLCGTTLNAQQQPVLFAEGIISNGKVFGLSLTPDGNKTYFVNSFGGRKRLRIMESEKLDGKWQKPKPAFFSDSLFREIDPFVSPDGNIILYNTRKGLAKNATDEKDLDIWMLKRTGKKWGKPFPIAAINSTDNETYATMAANGNIYFGLRSNEKGYGGNDIYVSRFVNGNYQQPVNLGYPINTKADEGNSFIAPDESYMIFSSDGNASGFGQSDLYISFNVKGHWSVPVNLGSAINSEQNDFCPIIFDGDTLLFARSKKTGDELEENIYCVKIDISFYKTLATLQPLPVLDKIFPDGDVYGITFSHNGKTAYTTRSSADRTTCEVYRLTVDANGDFIDPVKMDAWQLTSNVANPVISHDGNYALLRISGKAEPDIYSSQYINGNWTTPEVVKGNVNTVKDEYYPELTHSNQLFYSSSGNVYMADFEEGMNWVNARPVTELNTDSSESNAAISRDGKWLVFLSNRKGSYGSYDLYISQKNTTGWSNPVNLGPKINTNAMEYQPRFSIDDKMLYFTRSFFMNGKRQGRDEIFKVDISELLPLFKNNNQ